MQFNNSFEIFILCFSVSEGAIEHRLSFLNHTFQTERVGGRAREIKVLLLAAIRQYIFTLAFLSAESNTH